MRQTGLTIIFVAILLIGATWLYYYPKWDRHWTVGDCNSSGGAWNEQLEACEYCEDPSCMSPVGECQHYGGEWDTEEGVCVGAEGDPLPPEGGFQSLGE